MRVIALDDEILQLVTEDCLRPAADDQPGQWPRLAPELFKHNIVGQMIAVQVTVTEGMNEFPDFQITLLGNHVGQQGVRGNVERHPQKQIGTALVQLARQPPLAT